MHKTKLGISVGLMGAFICFLGLFFDVKSWLFLAIIGLVLWQEENAWLKKLVIKVAIISLCLLLVPYAVNVVRDIIDIIRGIFSINKSLWSDRIDFYIPRIVFLLRTFIFIMLGSKSLKQKHVSMTSIDNIINKNI